jgi:toxin-antitoxin system PIN domain toxin
MIAVDSNILVYSVREDSSWHEAALGCVRRVAEGVAPWAIPWLCIHEFIAVVTHPRIYKPATLLADALRQVDYWMESPSLRLLGEGPSYWMHLKEILSFGKAVGPIVHDGRIAAICRDYGVKEIWTADRDYSRFPGIRTRNPLIHSAQR